MKKITQLLIVLMFFATASDIFAQGLTTSSMNGKFWTRGYYVNTVGQYSNEEVIRAYVKNQGKEKEYKKLHQQQLNLLF